MERTLIAPGVHLSCDPAEKFNRCRISIHFAFPAQRATATAHALLPLVLERGYADCPDMTLLTKKLAKLYGADLTVDARPMGCNHNLCVSVTGIKDRFALEGEPLTREYASIALGAAFHPAFVGGVFDPQADPLGAYADPLEMRLREMESLVVQVSPLIEQESIEKDDYVRSIIHMTMNRLFRSKNRLYEMVIYDFLFRYYQSALARIKYAKK